MIDYAAMIRGMTGSGISQLQQQPTTQPQAPAAQTPTGLAALLGQFGSKNYWNRSQQPAGNPFDLGYTGNPAGGISQLPSGRNPIGGMVNSMMHNGVFVGNPVTSGDRSGGYTTSGSAGAGGFGSRSSSASRAGGGLY